MNWSMQIRKGDREGVAFRPSVQGAPAYQIGAVPQAKGNGGHG